MTTNDLNQIDQLLKTRLEESETRIMSKVKKIVGESENNVMLETGKFIEDHVLTVLSSHTKKLDSHTAILKQMKATLDSNNEDIVKLNKRTSVLEHKAGIVPPPELTVSR